MARFSLLLLSLVCQPLLAACQDVNITLDKQITSTIFSPAGDMLVTIGTIGASRGVLQLFQTASADPTTWTSPGSLSVAYSQTDAIAFTGDWLAVASMGQVYVYRRFELLMELQAVLQPSTDSVLSVAFSRDGALLAVGSESKSAIVWTISSILSTGQMVPVPAFTVAASAAVSSIDFHPDGRVVALGLQDGGVAFHQVSAANPWGSPFAAIDSIGVDDVAGTYSVNLRFSPDGSKIVVGRRSFGTAFYDWTENKPQLSASLNDGDINPKFLSWWITDIEYTTARTVAISMANSEGAGVIKIWSEQGVLIRALPYPTRVAAVACDPRHFLAVAEYKRMEVQIWGPAYTTDPNPVMARTTAAPGTSSTVAAAGNSSSSTSSASMQLQSPGTGGQDGVQLRGSTTMAKPSASSTTRLSKVQPVDLDPSSLSFGNWEGTLSRVTKASAGWSLYEGFPPALLLSLVIGTC